MLTQEEQEALEEAKREEERKQAEAAAKAASAKGKATSSKKEEVNQSTISAEQMKNDPNYNKFIPHLIRLNRTKMNQISNF